MNSILKRRLRTKRRVRAKVQGTSQVPRISVYRSNMHLYAQAIDDEAQKTLASSSDIKVAGKTSKKDSAVAVGKDLGEKLKALKISQAVFDRGYYKYTGRVQALADAVREANIKI